jgi:glycosyltransferase involved in cell wall biosynthesis
MNSMAAPRSRAKSANAQEQGASSRRLDGVRVLVVFGAAEMFGQERANLEVFRQMARLGLEVRFITSSRWGPDTIQPELDRMGLEWTTARFGNHWTKHMLGRKFGHLLRNLLGVAATSWRIRQEIRRRKPTHLYCMNWLFFSYALVAVFGCRLPFIYRAGDALPTHTRFHRALSKLIVRRSRALVCNSHFIARKLKAIAPPTVAVTVIYNYPPARNPSAIEPDVKVPVGAIVVVYIGQLTEHKGVHLLVEAISSLLKRGRNLSLLVAGESRWGDPLGPRLKDEVGKAGLEQRIQFLGYVHDVPGLLRKAQIHACPSMWEEPSPNVIMEAKREGVPSVVFASGGIPELIEHRVDGYICRERTAEALAEGIDYFAMNSAAVRQAGVAARSSLEEKFGEERFRRQWADVFAS